LALAAVAVAAPAFITSASETARDGVADVGAAVAGIGVARVGAAIVFFNGMMVAVVVAVQSRTVLFRTSSYTVTIAMAALSTSARATA
jgi:hypothetical protein